MRGITGHISTSGLKNAPNDTAPPPFPQSDSMPRSAAQTRGNGFFSGTPSQTSMAEAVRDYVQYYEDNARAMGRSPRGRAAAARHLQAYNRKLNSWFQNDSYQEGKACEQFFVRALGRGKSNQAPSYTFDQAQSRLIHNVHQHATNVLPDPDFEVAQQHVLQGLANYCLSETGAKQQIRITQAHGILGGLAPHIAGRRRSAFISTVNRLLDPRRNYANQPGRWMQMMRD